ncbi:hypothetical protein D9M71_753330 [compost metagenome]
MRKAVSEAYSLHIDASTLISPPASLLRAVANIMLRAAWSSVAMSASMWLMDWNSAMGWPNCLRVRAWSIDRFRARPAMPSMVGQCSRRFSVMRPMASLKPAPSSPMRFSTGTRTFSSRMLPWAPPPDITE